MELHLYALCLSGLFALAAGAPAPAPPASAPAPGTPGTTSVQQGNYTVRVTPSISVADVANAFAFATYNGTLSSAGRTIVAGTRAGLAVQYLTNVPGYINSTFIGKGSQTLPIIDGAACLSYSFLSNGTSSMLRLIDADAQLDETFLDPPPTLDYATCGASNCTSTRTIPLNATGHYRMVVSNSVVSYAWAAVLFTAYPAGSDACANLDTSQVPAPHVQQTPAFVIPTLQNTGSTILVNLRSSGTGTGPFFASTFRNASCIRVAMSTRSYYQAGRLPSNVTAYLVAEKGLEDIFNPKVSISAIEIAGPTAYCQTGRREAACSFGASGLNPANPYHLFVFYDGSANNQEVTEGSALITSASANSGDCSGLIAPFSKAATALPPAAAPSPSSFLPPFYIPSNDIDN